MSRSQFWPAGPNCDLHLDNISELEVLKQFIRLEGKILLSDSDSNRLALQVSNR